MRSQNPFDELDVPRKDRAEFLRRLFNYFMARDIPVAILTEYHRKRFDHLVAATHDKLRLYLCHDNRAIELAADLLSGISHWHRGRFCIILSESELVSELIREPGLLPLSIPDIEAKTSGHLYGYLFPLDNLLVCYGDAMVEEGVREVYAEVSGR